MVPGCSWSASLFAHSCECSRPPITVAGLTALSVEISTKRATPSSPREPRHESRRKCVVADRLDGVELHHRHVLVGGGVEDHGRVVLGDHLAHPLLLLAVGEHRDGDPDVAVLLELARDLKQVVLGVVEQDQPPRADAEQICRPELATDRAALRRSRARPRREGMRRLASELHQHGLATEDVLDPGPSRN